MQGCFSTIKVFIYTQRKSSNDWNALYMRKINSIIYYEYVPTYNKPDGIENNRVESKHAFNWNKCVVNNI